MLKDILVVSSFWLFQINLLWTFVYKSTYEHILSFLLGKHLGVEWVDYMVGICLNFKKLSKCFLKLLFNCTFPLAVYETANCFIFLPKLLIVNLFHFIHASPYIVVSHCGSNLLPND